MPARSVPILSDIASIIFCEDKCIEFLFQESILVRRSCCDLCGGHLNKSGNRFRCTKYSCQWSVSIFNETFFSGNRIKCNEAMHLGYLWLTNCCHDTMLQHTKHSTATITAYRQYFRQLVAENINPDDMVIGGDGIIVQIDETKMGKRKFNRGHRVEGAWVIVGVELTSERLVFAEVVESRNEETICDVLRKHVASGSILWTDCWRGYASIGKRFNIEHKTVNHSYWFKDPETGVNTNTVEGTNYALKHMIPPRNRTKETLPSFILEFVWRRKNKGHLWNAFINALRDTSYNV